MSEFIELLPVSFTPPVPGDIKGVGDVSKPFYMRNWLTMVKSFTIDMSIAGFGGTLTWDMTDPDGDRTPGTNPCGLENTCKIEGVPFTPYWAMRNRLVGDNFIEVNATNGDESAILAFRLQGPLFDIARNDDDRYYAISSAFTASGSTGDDPSDNWQITGFIPPDDTAESTTSFKWLDGTVPLYGTGDGRDGTITLRAATFWD